MRRIRALELVVSTAVFAVMVEPRNAARAGAGDPALPQQHEQGISSGCSCWVQVLHRGRPVPGFRIHLLPEMTSPTLGGTEPTTDFTGRMVVAVPGPGTLVPYLEQPDESRGWMILVLPRIEVEEQAGLCRQVGRIELVDTLVRGRVIDAATGRPIAGAILTFDNFGVRLEGEPPPERGILYLKTASGDDGSLAVPGLAPGRWHIRAYAEQATKGAEEKIILLEGDTLDLELAVVEGYWPPIRYNQGTGKAGDPNT